MSTSTSTLALTQHNKISEASPDKSVVVEAAKKMDMLHGNKNLKRTGKLFGGLVHDFKKRIKVYGSDYYDALNTKCITSILFMFFAAFAPAITFGGLLGDYTEGVMGIMETLAAQSLCGVLWGVFSVQPMMIVSPTGPIMIFEASLYKFCENWGLDFLVFRVWIGLWLVAIALLVVALEGVFLVSYVTQFTEDIFSSLISIIFIGESIKFLKKSFLQNPVMFLDYYNEQFAECIQIKNRLFPDTVKSKGKSILQMSSNDSTWFHNEGQYSTLRFLGQGNPKYKVDNDSVHHFYCPELKQMLFDMHEIRGFNESAVRSQLDSCCIHEHQPDTALLTFIMVFTTVVVAIALRKLRSSHYLGSKLRNVVSDCGVLIAILLVTLLDLTAFKEPYLQRLVMPVTPMFTDVGKRVYGLLIPFLLPDDKWWGYFFAAVPAFLVFILLFVETEITSLLLSKKERGLKKTCGFHWDLLFVGVLTLLCSILGLPWMCAAAVQSLAHASSLSVMNPHKLGEPETVSYVIEQRVTTICVAILIGACTFLGEFLGQMPLAVLFGVFLYLGLVSLAGIDMTQRMFLFFLPKKYFPDRMYCKKVPYWHLHMYTAIQIVCLAIIYCVKFFKVSSLGFPFVLTLIAVFRMYVLPKIYKTVELNALDGHDVDVHEQNQLII